MMMDRKALETLDFPKILAQLAEHTTFSAGRELALALTPTDDLREAQRRQEETAEARRLLVEGSKVHLGGVHDVRPYLVRATRGAPLQPDELLEIRSTLLSARSLKQTLTRAASHFPHLADIAARMEPCPHVAAEIHRCIDNRGEVRDGASPELSRIRRELREAHERLLSKLQKMVTAPANAAFLQEPLVTQRHGRYVIPVKAEFKGRIPGLVHDQSASGATLFIEPLATVELGNRWRECQLEEEREVRRILTELSELIGDEAPYIRRTVEALAELDLAFAKAKYAEAINGVQPKLVGFRRHGLKATGSKVSGSKVTSSKVEPSNLRTLEPGTLNPETITHPGTTLDLRAARHPLLDPATVVPIDVHLSPDYFVLVITGPNTGGKTVTLKTIGLLALMAQAGLAIPAAEGSALSVFDGIYADIGDEQSIEQSLSTFSSHLSNILSFIDRADDRSLVLLDELGAGTDPTEGSALARALLDAFRRRGATTLVATHYPELKAYAQVTPGVRNACVEFDPETLQPTYHLTIGLPGRSNAFAIARRLGLDEEIVRAAEAMVSQEDRQTEALLADIHRLRLQAAQERDAAHAARREAEREVEELRQRLAHIDEERAEVLRAARETAAAELEMLREEIRTLRRRLRAAAEPLAEVAAVEEEVEALEEEVVQAPAPAPIAAPPPPSRPVRPGDRVWVKPLRAEGTVLAVGETVEVQVGPARAQVAPDQVELRAGAKPAPEPTLPTYRPPQVETRIDLRGCTVEEALERLDRYLDGASLAGLPRVHIVHGKGTGALRRAVRDFLRDHPLVASYRAGAEGEGGDGVTVATLVGSGEEV